MGWRVVVLLLLRAKRLAFYSFSFVFCIFGECPFWFYLCFAMCCYLGFVGRSFWCRWDLGSVWEFGDVSGDWGMIMLCVALFLFFQCEWMNEWIDVFLLFAGCSSYVCRNGQLFWPGWSSRTSAFFRFGYLPHLVTVWINFFVSTYRRMKWEGKMD